MTAARVATALALIVVALCIFAWAGATPRAESLSRPTVAAAATAEQRGAAAFAGAGFGGISSDALASNAYVTVIAGKHCARANSEPPRSVDPASRAAETLRSVRIVAAAQPAFTRDR